MKASDFNIELQKIRSFLSVASAYFKDDGKSRVVTSYLYSASQITQNLIQELDRKDDEDEI